MKKIFVEYQDEETKRYYKMTLSGDKLIYSVWIKTPEIGDAGFQAEYVYDETNIFGKLQRITVFWIIVPVFLTYKDGLFVGELPLNGDDVLIQTPEEIEEVLEIIKLPIKVFDIDEKIKNMFIKKIQTEGYNCVEKGQKSTFKAN